MAHSGNPSVRTHSVKESLPKYTEAELAEKLYKAELTKKEHKLFHVTLAPRTPKPIDNDIAGILSPELNKSRFVTFREKFAENLYFKKPELGKVFPLEMKPKNSPDDFAHGTPTKKYGPIDDLIFPKKTMDEVNQDYVKWHEKYIISHGHHLPAEQINRRYDPKYFNKYQTFGKIYNVDFSGLGVKRALSEVCTPSFIKQTHARFLQENRPELGKCSKKNVYNVPSQGYFGHTKKSDGYHVKELLEHTEYSETDNMLRESFNYIQKIRRKLYARWEFIFHDFRLAFEKMDIKRTGFLRWSFIFKTAHKLLIHLDEIKTKLVAKTLGYTNDDDTVVNYFKFLKMLNLRSVLPSPLRTKSILYTQDSVYSQFSKEWQGARYCSSMRRLYLDKFVVQFPPKLRETTNAKNLVPPTITPQQLGISQKEFFMLRTKDEIRNIINRTINFEDDLFDVIWGEALRFPTTLGQRVSIDAFLYAMRLL